MSLRVVCHSAFNKSCLANADFVTPLNNKRTARRQKGERNREFLCLIQRALLPKRSIRHREIRACVLAYNLAMARAAMPATAWDLHEVLQPGGESRRTMLSPSRAPHITNRHQPREGGTMSGHVASSGAPKMPIGSSAVSASKAGRS